MLQLSDELPLLLVHVKVDAPVGYHLTRTQNIFRFASANGVREMPLSTLTPEPSVSASRDV